MGRIIPARTGPQGPPGPAGPGGASDLYELDDVAVSARVAGNPLVYDGSEWTVGGPLLHVTGSDPSPTCSLIVSQSGTEISEQTFIYGTVQTGTVRPQLQNRNRWQSSLGTEVTEWSIAANARVPTGDPTVQARIAANAIWDGATTWTTGVEVTAGEIVIAGDDTISVVGANEVLISSTYVQIGGDEVEIGATNTVVNSTIGVPTSRTTPAASPSTFRFDEATGTLYLRGSAGWYSFTGVLLPP